MSIKTGRKIGFFAALTMLIGTVVGIGIFFKNGSVLGAANNNGATALTGWIIGGLLALFAAISFSELGSMKISKVSGLPAWSEDVGGKKYGYFVRVTFNVFYFGLLTPLLGFFVSELLFQFLLIADAIDSMPKVWILGLISLLFTAFSLTINSVSIKTSGMIQQLVTIIKFVPIILAIIIGIALPNTHNDGGKNYFHEGEFTFTGLLAGLPAILFSYDAFLGVGQITNKVKGGSKTVSKVVLVGLISVMVVYLLLAISAMFHSGSIAEIIIDSLPKKVAKGINIFVYLMLFFSGYGVLNGVSAGAVSSFEQLVESETLFGIKKMKSIIGSKKTSILFLTIYISMGFILSIVPGMIIGSDQYVDAVSNYPSLFFFAVYALTILLYSLKRNSIESTKLNKYVFYIASSLFIIGVLFIVIYQLFYGFTYKTLSDSESLYKGLGLFAPLEHKINNLEFFIIFISFLFLFFILPLVNYLLVKLIEKRNPMVKTQKNTHR